MSITLIEVSKLKKQYENKVVLNSINFTIQKNEVLGILGLNGAGKTTLLKILAGILPPTEGEIYLNGKLVYSSFDSQNNYDFLNYKNIIKIGYLPEFVTLYPELTVKDFLYFIMTIKNIPKDKQKEEYEYIIRKAHLEGYQSVFIKHLSQGYQKRTGIAQTIAGNPDFIILDEPITGLDPKQIIEIRNLIRELVKEHTIILSSHILSEVAQTCDRVYILHKNTFVKEVTKEEMPNIEKIFMEATNA
ncbi:MAG: ABC transporter ATP-binding protein [Leptospiraceae bacterium]|nr:ABC transporter ATP-binding protein [Leptospiraceae bacterium]MDW7976834.1 ABC transporter ATP-binding protein [Leptospiraceae bacterium]